MDKQVRKLKKLVGKYLNQTKEQITKEWKKPLKEQFKNREEAMAKNIEVALKKYKKIVIVVGDTHLRTIDTPELGPKSPFYNRDYTIIRSKYKEIK